MPAVDHSYSFADALARQADVYEVEFPSWGTRLLAPAVGVPDPNLQYPPPGQAGLPAGVAAVSIGERSTVDRCWLSWDRRKFYNVPPADVTQPDLVISSTRLVTVRSPLLFPQSASRGTLGPTQSLYEAMQLGLVYAFPFGLPPVFPNPDASGNVLLTGQKGTTTCTPISYIDQFGASTLWGGAEAPFLHLRLHLRPPIPVPWERAPLARSIASSVASGVTSRLLMVPIYGRRRLRVSIVSSAGSGNPAGSGDFYLGLIRNVNESVIGNPSFNQSPVVEVRAASALNVPANTPVELSADNPCADYAVVHVANDSGGPAFYVVTLVAED